MAQLKLYYTHNLNPRLAVAVARHLQSPVQFIRYSPMGEDREAFLPINPNSLAPLLVEEGRPRWEADSIALRLSRLAGGSFWPDEHVEDIQMWLSWSAHHFTLAASTINFENTTVPLYMGRDTNAALVAECTEDFHRFAAILDDTLADRNWLVGDRLTYADFRVASSLPYAERGGIPVFGYGNIMRWYGQLNAIDAWRDPFAGLD